MRTDMPRIKNNTFTLRDITINDYLDLYYIGKDFDTTRYLTWGPFEHPNEAKILIEKFNLPRIYEGLPIGYAIVDNKTGFVIGLIEFHTYYPNDNSAELGFILMKEYWHKGIMSRALRIMINLGFEHLNLNKIIVAHVDLNEACKNLVIKNHFKYEYTSFASFKTKDTGELRNIIYYSLYKDEYEGGL